MFKYFGEFYTVTPERVKRLAVVFMLLLVSVLLVASSVSALTGFPVKTHTINPYGTYIFDAPDGIIGDVVGTLPINFTVNVVRCIPDSDGLYFAQITWGTRYYVMAQYLDWSCEL